MTVDMNYINKISRIFTLNYDELKAERDLLLAGIKAETVANVHGSGKYITQYVYQLTIVQSLIDKADQ